MKRRLVKLLLILFLTYTLVFLEFGGSRVFFETTIPSIFFLSFYFFAFSYILVYIGQWIVEFSRGLYA